MTRAPGASRYSTSWPIVGIVLTGRPSSAPAQRRPRGRRSVVLPALSGPMTSTVLTGSALTFEVQQPIIITGRCLRLR